MLADTLNDQYLLREISTLKKEQNDKDETVIDIKTKGDSTK